jgi:hypothetical protein
VTVPEVVVVPAGYTGPDWDRFVADAPDATFCHLAGWRDVIEDTLGHEALYAVALDTTGAWRGVLPLVRVKSALFGHYLVSMPFLNAGGPIGSGAACAALEESAVREARRSGADLLELRTPGDQPTALTASQRKITVTLQLPRQESELWKQFTPKLRSQVKRPLRENSQVRFGLEERDAFYDVFSRHMRDLGTPVLSREFFRTRRPGVFRPRDLRDRVLRWSARRRRVRVCLAGQVRADLGVGVTGTQPGRAEHAALLGVHAGNDSPRPPRVRFRALHTRRWHPSVQAPMGRS